MESNSLITGLRVSGNLNADCTLLISDIFGLFPSSFSKLLPMLEARYRIISYNDNGFDLLNRATFPRHKDFKGYAADLLLFLHERKAENVTYLAHSVNALLAFQAASKEPEMFDKIILLAATPYLVSNLSAMYDPGTGSEPNQNILFDNVLRENHAEDSQQLPAFLRQAFLQYGADKARYIFDILTAADFRPNLSEITVPVMILQGIGDKIATSDTAYFLHRHIPESYLIRIRAKGHLPQLTAPEEIFNAMEIFMHPAVC